MQFLPVKHFITFKLRFRYISKLAVRRSEKYNPHQLKVVKLLGVEIGERWVSVETHSFPLPKQCYRTV